MPSREERGLIIGKNVRKERELRGWTRAELAERLGTGESSVSRWELEGALPHPYTRRKICQLFGITEQELEQAREESGEQAVAAPPQADHLLYWNIPYQRNSYFTGREELLRRLHNAFFTEEKVGYPTVRALCGIGGLGKTQTAVEYCYRHLGEYRAIIWIRAENPEVLDADFAELALLLDLEYQGDEEQRKLSHLPRHHPFDRKAMIQRVKKWLREHPAWLLVFDNVEDLDQVIQYFPQYGSGAILLTTRSQTMRHAITKLVMGRMSSEEATQFLFRRSKGLAANEALPDIPQGEYEAAETLWRLLGGLPLALDQVAAFAEETGCSLRDYLALFQQQPEFLLKQRGEAGEKAYPSSVATTWQLSFTFIEQNHPQAADLLRFCAFLHPDDIPDELFAHSYFEPYLQTVGSQRFSIHHLTRPLLKYSLVQRDPDHGLMHIHRLVQMVLKDRMDSATRILWAERALKAVHAVFPDGALDNWDASQRYFPHVQACTQHIEEYALQSPMAASLLNRAGYYLFKRTMFEQARSLLERALAMRETLLGPEHLDTAETLFNLGMLAYECGQYESSSSYLRRTLAIFEKHALPPDDARLAEVYIYLGFCAQTAGQWSEAETLHLRALEIHERNGGEWSLTIATSLNALADDYMLLGRLQEVERLLQRVLAIRSAHLPADAPSLGETINDLGVLYYSQGRYTEAEPLYRRALAILEKSLGSGHRMTALVLHSLGQLYRALERYQEAEQYIQRALHLRRQILGRHSDTAITMNQLGLVYLGQGRYAEAETVLRLALAIQKEHVGEEHFLTSVSINSLGLLLSRQGQHAEAERYLKLALSIREQKLGARHRLVAESLHAIGQLYMSSGRYREAETAFQRALAIRRAVLGEQHPDTSKTEEGYKELLERMGGEQ